MTNTQTETTELRNEKTVITYRPERKEIAGQDLTDLNNMPAFYTQTKRSIKKAWASLQENFNSETKMYDAMTLIEDAKVRTRSYCQMD